MKNTGRAENGRARGRIPGALALCFLLLFCVSFAAGEELTLSAPDETAAGQEARFILRYQGEDRFCDVTVSLTALYENGTAALLTAGRRVLGPGEDWTVAAQVPYACVLHLEAEGETASGRALRQEVFSDAAGVGADWPELALEGPESCPAGEEMTLTVRPRGGLAPYTVRLSVSLDGQETDSQIWHSEGEAVLGLFSFSHPGTVLAEAEVTDARGLKAYGEVLVPCTQAPLRLEADRTRLTEGESVGLRVLQEGTAWSFSSSDPSVLRVDERGLVTAAGEGTAVIRCGDGEGREAALRMSVLPAAKGMTVEGLTLQAGQRGQLRPILAPEGARSGYLYLSADPSVATVDEKGVVTAVGAGRTAVTVIPSEAPFLAAAAEIRVLDEAEERTRAYAYGLFFSGTGEGGELAASYGAVSSGPCEYTLSLERDGIPLAVKTRSEAGVVRFYLADAVPGCYRLTVTALDGAGCLATAETEGEITRLTEGGIRFEKRGEETEPLLTRELRLTGPRRLLVGQRAAFRLETVPGNVLGPFRWESLRPEIAQVDREGTVTALGEGSVLLRVTALDGSGVRAELEIACVRESLSIGADTLLVHRGDTVPLEVASATGQSYDYVYTPSDPELFQVRDGVLTALKEGRGTLTVACAGGECEAVFPVRVAACLHREGTWQVSKEPGCLREGERVFVCAVCGETARRETLPALRHDRGRWSTLCPATPRWPGERVRCCTRCGAVLERDPIPCITRSTYNLNTACSEGFSFRELFYVREWYMFTPLDVSRDGLQTVRLIASNMYQIGTVYVEVQAGQIRVTYDLVSPVLKFTDEFVTFLPSLAAFRGADPALYRNYAFGIWYDLEEAGCGEGLALLFIRNRINYEKTTPGMVLFSPEQPTHREYQRRLIWLLEQRLYGE